MKLQFQAISQNPTILLLLSLAHAYILLTKIFIHHSPFLRLVSIIPTVYIFFIIPWTFPSALIRGLLSYFIVWIASFKILAYCFLTGPQVPCATSFLDFATLAIFPFKKNERKAEKSSVMQFFQDAAPLAWLITVLNLYIFMAQNDQSNQSILMFYSAVAASWLALVKNMTGYVTVPIFDRPYLSTSLQQFWGQKWNKYSSYMLRLTVYDPARKLLNQCVGLVPARLAATFLTLAVSGMMHELMLYYISCGKKPTWEASWYFLLQGVSLGVESLFKYLWLKIFKWRPIRPILSMLIVDGFVASTFYVFIVRPVSVKGQNHC